MAKKVANKRKGICVIKDMAAGMTKKEARKDCGVVPGGTKKQRKGRGRKGKAAHKAHEKCHGSVHVMAHERGCPHK